MLNKKRDSENEATKTRAHGGGAEQITQQKRQKCTQTESNELNTKKIRKEKKNTTHPTDRALKQFKMQERGSPKGDPRVTAQGWQPVKGRPHHPTEALTKSLICIWDLFLLFHSFPLFSFVTFLLENIRCCAVCFWSFCVCLCVCLSLKCLLSHTPRS